MREPARSNTNGAPRHSSSNSPPVGTVVRPVRASTKCKPPAIRRRHERPAVGAEDEALGLADAPDDADRRRALEQRGEQVAARLHGVAERDALACEQQREVEVIGGERLGAEALRVGGGLAFARLVALVERDDAGDHRQHEQRRDAGEPRPQPPLGAAARAPAGLEEGALGGVELVAVLGRPVERGGQSGAAVETGRDRARRPPRRRRPRAAGAAGGVPRCPRPASRAAAAIRAAAPRARPRPCPRRPSAGGAR